MTPLVAIVGGSGFIGSHVKNELGLLGMPCTKVGRVEPSVAVFTDPIVGEEVVEAVDALPRATLDDCVEQLRDADVVVNAAGSASPKAESIMDLVAPNCVLPLVLQRACAIAGVSRMVHVSSAAVQGVGIQLDESMVHHAESPYARSKAIAEVTLLSSPWSRDVATVVYRPTSVHGPSQDVTRSLKALHRLPIIPILGDGSAPVPITTAASVARAVAHIVMSSDLTEGPVLHPWEGVTQAVLSDYLADHERRLRLPKAATSQALEVGSGCRLQSVAAIARRASVFLLGQVVAADRLERDGFEPFSPTKILEQI